MPITTVTIAQPRLELVDPHDCTDVKHERSVHEALFDALVTRRDDLKIVPHLARSWTVSPDGRVWTFSLSQGVQFHNGEPFNGQAAKFSLERMANPEMGAALGAPAVYAQYLGDMEVRVLDEYTIEVTLESPNADLLDVLVEGYMLPPRAVQRMGDSFKSNPIGTGAYRFGGWMDDKVLVAHANTSYFKGTPDGEKIVWKILPDAEERVAQLRDGSVDVISRVAPECVQRIDEMSKAHVVELRGPTCIIYLFNCSQGPMRESKVRQAINFAVDKVEIINSVLDGAAYLLSGFVSPLHFGFDPELKPFPHDPDRALQLLSEAGYGDGLEITMDTPTSSPREALQVSELIARQLAEVNIDTSVRITTDRAAYASNVRRKEIGDICCFDSSPLSTYRVLREKISSRFEGAWWQGYKNEEVDRLIEEGNRTIDRERREAIYRRCFRLIHEDPPWLFLYNHENTFGVGDRLGNWEPRLDGCIIPQSMHLRR